MSKTRTILNGDSDTSVADRIESFYDAFPQGRIITELVSRADGEITFKASVFRTAADPAPAATGWAAERENNDTDGTASCLQETETAAISRALANLGFTPSRRAPSTHEAEKPDRVARTPSPLGIGTRPPEPPAFPPPRAASASVTAAAAPASDHAGREAISDVLALLDTAERSGYSADRGQAVRQRLAGGDVPASSLLRVERALRRWLAERDEHRG
jgi:hypothetical protein